MLQRRAVIWFSAIAIVVYAALSLAWAWPPFERAYTAYFRAVGNVAFSQFWFWPNAEVHFFDLKSETLRTQVNAKLPANLPDHVELLKPHGEVDTLLLLQNNHVPGTPGFMRTSSSMIGFAPTAVLIALALATPIAWKRRWWLLFWGLIAMHLAIVVRLTALLLNAGFADPAKKYALFHPGGLTADIIARTRVILADNPTFSYVVAVFIWVLVLFLLQCWYEWRPGRSRDDQKAS